MAGAAGSPAALENVRVVTIDPTLDADVAAEGPGSVPGAAARASGELNAGPPDERPLGARVCEALDHAVRNANPMAALDRMEGDPDPAAVAALLDLVRLYAVFQDMAARLELRGRRRFEPAH